MQHKELGQAESNSLLGAGLGSQDSVLTCKDPGYPKIHPGSGITSLRSPSDKCRGCPFTLTVTLELFGNKGARVWFQQLKMELLLLVGNREWDILFPSCLLIQAPPFVHLPCFTEHMDCAFPGARTVFLVTCQHSIGHKGSLSPYLGFSKASTEQAGHLCVNPHSSPPTLF